MCSCPLNLTAREPSLRVGRWQEASTALMRSALLLKLLTSLVRIVGHTTCGHNRRQDRHNDFLRAALQVDVTDEDLVQPCADRGPHYMRAQQTGMLGSERPNSYCNSVLVTTAGWLTTGLGRGWHNACMSYWLTASPVAWSLLNFRTSSEF